MTVKEISGAILSRSTVLGLRVGTQGLTTIATQGLRLTSLAWQFSSEEAPSHHICTNQFSVAVTEIPEIYNSKKETRDSLLFFLSQCSLQGHTLNNLIP